MSQQLEESIKEVELKFDEMLKFIEIYTGNSERQNLKDSIKQAFFAGATYMHERVKTDRIDAEELRLKFCTPENGFPDSTTDRWVLCFAKDCVNKTTDDFYSKSSEVLKNLEREIK